MRQGISPVKRQLCKFWLVKAPLVKTSQLWSAVGGGVGGGGGHGGGGAEQGWHSWAGVEQSEEGQSLQALCHHTGNFQNGSARANPLP